MSNSDKNTQNLKYIPTCQDEERIEELSDITGIANDAEACVFGLRLLKTLLESEEHAGRLAIKSLDGQWRLAPTLQPSASRSKD